MMEIKILDYDPNWITQFSSEAEAIHEIVKDNEMAILHIGSTSVPGLAAKPIIDILLIVEAISKLDDVEKDLARLGYEALGENGLPGRRFFRKGKRKRTHHVHAYQFDNISEIQRHIAFRNYLRAHRNIAEEYAELKRSIAKQYPANIDKYSLAKDPFIKAHEAKALQYIWSKEAE